LPLQIRYKALQIAFLEGKLVKIKKISQNKRSKLKEYEYLKQQISLESKSFEEYQRKIREISAKLKV